MKKMVLLWTTRNKMPIEKNFPSKPVNVMYTVIYWLQKWRPLLKPKDRDKLEQVKSQVLDWLKNLRPNEVLATEIWDLM